MATVEVVPESEVADKIDSRLTDFIGYAMKRALSIVQADLSRVLSEFGLRAGSVSTLTIIDTKTGLTQTQVADALQIERSNLVTLIDELAGRNLIIRAPMAQDRRRHALMPTASGKQLATFARNAVAAHERKRCSCLTVTEQEGLKRILSKFRGAALRLTCGKADGECWQGILAPKMA